MADKATEYILEVLANDGGFRGLLINKKNGLVERRTKVNDTKESAFMALEELITTFLNTYPNNVIKGVSKTDGAFIVSRTKVRGLDD